MTPVGRLRARPTARPPSTRLGWPRTTELLGALVRAELQAASAYRAQLVIGLFGWVVPLAFMALWRGAAADDPVSGITVEQFTTYFSILLVTTNLSIGMPVVAGLSGQVHSGQLSAILLRPHHPILPLVARALAQKAFRLPPLLVIVPLLVVLGDGAVTDDLGPWLLAPVVAVLGLIASVYLAGIVATVAFWMTKSSGVQGLLTGLEWLVGGLVAPIALLPGVLPEILRHQPLWFAIGAPAELVAGMGDHSPWMVAEAVLWIAVLDRMFRSVWRRALARYEAVGT